MPLELCNFHWPPGGVFVLDLLWICKPPSGEYILKISRLGPIPFPPKFGLQKLFSGCGFGHEFGRQFDVVDLASSKSLSSPDDLVSVQFVKPALVSPGVCVMKGVNSFRDKSISGSGLRYKIFSRKDRNRVHTDNHGLI